MLESREVLTSSSFALHSSSTVKIEDNKDAVLTVSNLILKHLEGIKLQRNLLFRQFRHKSHF